MPFSKQEWAIMLNVSTQSINSIKKERKKLTGSQSKKVN
jgi:hypothetical protein